MTLFKTIISRIHFVSNVKISSTQSKLLNTEYQKSYLNLKAVSDTTTPTESLPMCLTSHKPN